MLIRNPFEEGLFKTSLLTTANPAAGANATIVVHANARSELLCLSFQLATDANAANRVAYLEYRRGGTHCRIGSAITQQSASKTVHYIVASQIGLWSGTTATMQYIPIASLPVIFPTDTIEVIIENIQATDAITTIISLWKVWPYEAI